MAKGMGWWVATVAFAVAAINAAAGETSVAAEAAVRKVEAQRVEAILKGDTVTLERILAPDLTYMHSSGILDTKESYLASLSSGRLTYKGFDESDVRVRVYGDAAVVTGRAMARAQRGDDLLVTNVALTAVYAKGRDGAWRLVAWQTTRLPE
jgi:ketosteroid isomerase-like protein